MHACRVLLAECRHSSNMSQALWIVPSAGLQYVTFLMYSSTRQILFSWYVKRPSHNEKM
jgi:hypothetical protein